MVKFLRGQTLDDSRPRAFGRLAGGRSWAMAGPTGSPGHPAAGLTAPVLSEAQRIAALISKLGDPQYAVRQEARGTGQVRSGCVRRIGRRPRQRRFGNFRPGPLSGASDSHRLDSRDRFAAGKRFARGLRREELARSPRGHAAAVPNAAQRIARAVVPADPLREIADLGEGRGAVRHAAIRARRHRLAAAIAADFTGPHRQRSGAGPLAAQLCSRP